MINKLVLDKQGHTAVITMNNLPANTWTAESLQGLTAIIQELNADREIYVIVICSASDKFFSAGADLTLFADGNPTVAADMAHHFGQAFETLSAFRGVTIAAINGFAMGGGLEVALACDIRVVEETAQLALPEAKVGLLPCAGGTQNLTMLVGEGWAKRMILCGERVNGYLAKEIGLAEELVSKGEAYNRAMRLAESVAQQSPTSVTACKKLIQSHRTRSWRDGYSQERTSFVELFETADQKEGVSAFLEKRLPKWKNG
jgi:enoyl-CoA hydratase/carnithine racemase|tara:strand:- start:393 stop:1169 length:777 start_codon:yes stop_codon:yes gene_type:complete